MCDALPVPPVHTASHICKHRPFSRPKCKNEAKNRQNGLKYGGGAQVTLFRFCRHSPVFQSQFSDFCIFPSFWQKFYFVPTSSVPRRPTWEGYRNSQKARRSISISPSIRQLFPYPTKNRVMDPYRAIVLPPGPLSQKWRTRRYCLVLSPPISF